VFDQLEEFVIYKVNRHVIDFSGAAVGFCAAKTTGSSKIAAR